METLESRASKANKVMKAVGGLGAFLAGWRYDFWYADEALMLGGLYLMYTGRDTIDYLKAAYGRKKK